MKKTGRLVEFDLNPGAPESYDQAMRCGALIGRDGMKLVQSGKIVVSEEARKFTLAFPDGFGCICYLVWRRKKEVWEDYYHCYPPTGDFRMVVVDS